MAPYFYLAIGAVGSGLLSAINFSSFRKARQMRDAFLGTALVDKDSFLALKPGQKIRMENIILSALQPTTSPLSHQPCVWWEVFMTTTSEEGSIEPTYHAESKDGRAFFESSNKKVLFEFNSKNVFMPASFAWNSNPIKPMAKEVDDFVKSGKMSELAALRGTDLTLTSYLDSHKIISTIEERIVPVGKKLVVCGQVKKISGDSNLAAKTAFSSEKMFFADLTLDSASVIISGDKVFSETRNEMRTELSLFVFFAMVSLALIFYSSYIFIRS